jgi:SAM-dependent methyltransferase
MHKRVQKFCLSQIERFQKRGLIPTNPDVLDCGSLDINGNNRYLFPNAKSYTGIDIVEGPNVDIVTRVADFAPEEKYDVVISTEMLEHDEQWHKSLNNMRDHVKPGGMLLITAAGTGRPEHGTSECHPKDSPLTHEYYKNITMAMLIAGLDVWAFSHFEMRCVEDDIQFVGIKKQ